MAIVPLLKSLSIYPTRAFVIIPEQKNWFNTGYPVLPVGIPRI
jgi:hypothetical protein